MKISEGDIVCRKDGKKLYSGAACYNKAVVISLDPFAITSLESDMLWKETITIDDFKVIGPAPLNIYNKCKRRLLEINKK